MIVGDSTAQYIGDDSHPIGEFPFTHQRNGTTTGVFIRCSTLRNICVASTSCTRIVAGFSWIPPISASLERAVNSARHKPSQPLLLTAAVGVGKSTAETAYDIPGMSQ